MVNAPTLFDKNGSKAHRLFAFEDAVRHFPSVRTVNSDLDTDTVTVYFEGHRGGGVPAPMRDLAKSLCIELPAPGNQRFMHSDDVTHGYRDHSQDEPETVVTFRLGGPMASLQR